jgi:hypothetical protein
MFKGGDMFKTGDRVRVYCMHGYFDGTINRTEDVLTTNQPKKAQRMVWVDKALGGGSWNHPKQCRKLKKPAEKTITKRKLIKALTDGLTNDDVWDLL